jgi:transposase
VRHRQTKGAENSYAQPTATAPHLDSTEPEDVGATARDNRRFREAVLYRYRAGIPWRDWPERFGGGKNTHRRFSRWAEAGVWDRVFQSLAADADYEYAMIDSTIVRAHHHSAIDSAFVLTEW